MTINVDVALSAKKIYIGRQEDNQATQIVFDCSSLVENYGNGTVTLLHRRSEDDVAYIVQGLVQGDNTVTWTISADDTGYAGKGELQLLWTVNSVVKHTSIYTTYTYPSLTDTTSEPAEVKSALTLLIESVVDTYTKAEIDAMFAEVNNTIGDVETLLASL